MQGVGGGGGDNVGGGGGGDDGGTVRGGGDGDGSGGDGRGDGVAGDGCGGGEQEQQLVGRGVGNGGGNAHLKVLQSTFLDKNLWQSNVGLCIGLPLRQFC